MDIEQINKLEQLKELLDNGIISKQEFNSQKKEIFEADSNLSQAKPKASSHNQPPPPSDGRPQNIIQCYKAALQNYFNFKTRASRYEYWGFIITNFFISLAIGIFDTILGTTNTLSGIYTLILLIPSLAIYVRRFHDTNKSGLYLFVPFGIALIIALLSSIAQYNNIDLSRTSAILYLITFITAGIIFLYWLCKKGDATANRYGEATPAETPHEKKVFITAVVLFLLIPTLLILLLGIISSHT